MIRRKTIWIIISVVLILVIGLLISWRHARVRVRKVPVKKYVVAAVAKKKRLALPAIAKRITTPKVAIVMDDFGYNKNNLDELFGINKPITLSILPHLVYSKEIANIAHSKGYEVILHLPLEPHRKDVKEEVDTINSKMSEKEVISRLESAIESVPGLKGVSSHMGSKSTEEVGLMAWIIGYLKKQNLYFLDSLTSERSVSGKVAKELGARYTRRDIFLDNDSNPDYIKGQILSLRKLAFRKGRVVAICHDRKNTIKVLSEMMPQLEGEGIKFVYASEMAR